MGSTDIAIFTSENCTPDCVGKIVIGKSAENEIITSLGLLCAQFTRGLVLTQWYRMCWMGIRS